MRELPTPRWFAIVATSALCLALAGCGGGDRAPSTETAGADAAIDPCSLLALDELVEIVGNPLVAGASADEPGQCHWNSQAPEDVSIVLALRAAGSTEVTQSCAELPAATSEFEAESWQFQALPVGAIAVLEACGDRGWVSVTLAGGRDEDELRTAARSIAVRALAQL